MSLRNRLARLEDATASPPAAPPGLPELTEADRDQVDRLIDQAHRIACGEVIGVTDVLSIGPLTAADLAAAAKMLSSAA